MEDAADDAPIVDARFTGLAARKVRFECTPSLIAQPEQMHRTRPTVDGTQIGW
jgi:hypothetical protein